MICDLAWIKQADMKGVILLGVSLVISVALLRQLKLHHSCIVHWEARGFFALSDCIGVSFEHNPPWKPILSENVFA